MECQREFEVECQREFEVECQREFEAECQREFEAECQREFEVGSLQVLAVESRCCRAVAGRREGGRQQGRLAASSPTWPTARPVAARSRHSS